MGLLLIAAVVLLVAALVLRSAHPESRVLVAGVAIAGAVAGWCFISSIAIATRPRPSQ